MPLKSDILTLYYVSYYVAWITFFGFLGVRHSPKGTAPTGRSIPKVVTGMKSAYGDYFKRCLAACATVLTGAMILMSVALYNGRPFVFWDTALYLAVGQLVFSSDTGKTAVALYNDPALDPETSTQAVRDRILNEEASHLGARSITYSVFLDRAANWGSLWIAALLQCLLVVGTLRALLKRLWPQGYTEWGFLLLCALLAVLTPVSVVAALLMPDIFVAPMVMLIALMFLERERWRYSDYAIACGIILVCILVHLTHAPIAFVIVAGGFLLTWLWTGRARSAAPAAAAVLGCIVLAFAINGFLVAKVESNLGVQLSLPPFMTGRVIDDVSGRKYIEAGCVPQQFEICRFADRIAKRPRDAGGALTWIREAENGGVYLVEDLETRAKLRAENLAFAEAAVRAYPFTQVYRSLRNFARLLVSYRLNIGSSQLDYTYSDYATAVGWPGAALILQYGPGTEECALTPKQNCGRVQLNRFLIPHHLTLLLAAGVLAWYAYVHIKDHGLRFSNLGAVEFAIVFFVGAIVANALVCGVLGGPHERYQTRIAWLIPALAGGCLLFSAQAEFLRRRVAGFAQAALGPVARVGERAGNRTRKIS